MRVINNTGLNIFDDAVKLFSARVVLLLRHLKQMPKDYKFHMSEDSPSAVSDRYWSMMESNGFIRIVAYRHWNPLSSVNGYYENRTIYVNKWKIGKLSIDQWAGLIAHELCHDVGYKHEFKPTKDRNNTVPYYVGRFVSGEIK